MGLCYQPGVASLPTVIYMKECCFAISPCLILKLRQGSNPITTYHAGGAGRRYLHGITPWTYPEHTEIIIPTDRAYFPHSKPVATCAGHTTWHGWVGILQRAGPQQESEGHSHWGCRAICSTTETLERLDYRTRAWSLWGHTPEKPPIQQCFDSENRKRMLYFKVETTEGLGPGESIFTCVVMNQWDWGIFQGIYAR